MNEMNEAASINYLKGEWAKNESLWNVNELEWIGLASKKRLNETGFDLSEAGLNDTSPANWMIIESR